MKNFIVLFAFFISIISFCHGQLYSIGNRVWYDNNKNGIQEKNEPGIPGMTVILYSGTYPLSSSLIAYDTTSATGHYSFDSLPSGQYYIICNTPGGFSPTLKDVGTNDAIDSDCTVGPSPGSNNRVMISPIILSSNNNNLDMGLYRNCSIGTETTLLNYERLTIDGIDTLRPYTAQLIVGTNNVKVNGFALEANNLQVMQNDTFDTYENDRNNFSIQTKEALSRIFNAVNDPEIINVFDTVFSSYNHKYFDRILQSIIWYYTDQNQNINWLTSNIDTLGVTLNWNYQQISKIKEICNKIIDKIHGTNGEIQYPLLNVKYLWNRTDNGRTDLIISSSAITQCIAHDRISISGSIYLDNNGLNGSPVNTIDGFIMSPGYSIVLVDSLTNTVVAANSTNGSIYFAGVFKRPYSLILKYGSTPAVGSPAPLAQNGQGFLNIGEYLGNGAGSDGIVDGTLHLPLSTGNIINAKFGIKQAPISNSITKNIISPIVGQLIPFTGGANPSSPTGSDGSTTLGAGNNLIIVSVPTSTNLLYNGLIVSNNQLIENFNPNFLQIEITHATIGTTSTSFLFNFLDIAGLPSATPATYTITWLTSVPLSSTVVDFKAIKNGSFTYLNWSTDLEQNTLGFEVQKSNDSKNWEVLDFIENETNLTKKNSIIPYTFIDKSPFSGRNFYRLKLVEFSNKVTFSEIKFVNHTFSKNIEIYPNPAYKLLNFNISDEQWKLIREISIDDMLGKNFGRIIISNTISKNISIDYLPFGIYVLRVVYKNGEIGVKSFVKR